ncbi:MAG TPA: hypothetical protein VFV01_47910 [Spirillospora sp.]|nr:hypothetical protein [Spirillospora sp.]
MSHGRGVGAPGFHDATFEPVAAPFLGLRAFLVDTERRPVRTSRLASSMGTEVTEAEAVGTLRGVFKSEYVWVDGTNQAHCLSVNSTPHRAPLQDCGCGFWAYSEARSRWSTGASHLVAYGIVQGWGRMVVGPRGFRSEYARVVALALDDRPPEVVASQLSELLRTLRAAAEAARALAEAVGRRPGAVSPSVVEAVAEALRRSELAAAREAVARHYPSVQLFERIEPMVRRFPPTDLAGLLAEGEAEEDEPA